MPFFPMYAQELLADGNFQIWSPAARGCWLTLSARCWSDGSIPDDLETIGRLCGETDAQAMLKHWSSIATKFLKHPILPNRLVSPRIEKERELAILKADKLTARGRAGATQRWKDKIDMPKQCLSNAKAMLVDATSPSPLKDVPPLPPKGDSKRKSTRKPKLEVDISVENQDQFDLVWKAWPPTHPVTGEEVHKGSKAQAERAFQKIISTGEATARELKVSGILYAKAEKFGEPTQTKVYQAWDHRNHAMMHVSSFFGPDKRAYKQLLQLAKEEINKVESKGAV